VSHCVNRSQYRTLYSDEKKFKEYIEMCQVLFDLLAIVEQPDADTEVLGEVFAAITCLTDNGLLPLPLSNGSANVCILYRGPT